MLDLAGLDYIDYSTNKDTDLLKDKLVKSILNYINK